MFSDDIFFYKIAEALLADYTCVYYVNAVTNEYRWYTTDQEYSSLHISASGKNFFLDLIRDAEKVVHEDDKHIFTKDMHKEDLLAQIKKGTMQDIEYRLMIGGQPVYHKLRLIRGISENDGCFILGVQNTDKGFRERMQKAQIESEREIYSQIAHSLASHYDVIYYVDPQDNYVEFQTQNIYDSSEMPEKGTDFFSDAKKNSAARIHPKDRERLMSIINRESVISALENKRQITADYRRIVNGIPKYTRLTAMWSCDKQHLIIGVENVDDEVKKENEQIQALNFANELARRDQLTGTKNMTAYNELENSVQKNIDSGMDYMPFAIVVCDINGLKAVNDTKGHKAGDEYIRSASRLICNVFTHSPVFRIGGDEFAAFLGTNDYYDRDELIERIKGQVRENQKKGTGPVIAVGISSYDSTRDKKVSEVFERADKLMYEDKARLKDAEKLALVIGHDEAHEPIPDDRVKKLDSLFQAFSLVSEGAYVYICDMLYDYSRWSRSAVDTFALPAEYMYDAGNIWEEHIHPDDQDTYHAGISDVFTGNASGHDMQYRARKPNGEYDVCTCRGVVLRNAKGEPEYFGGVIRNHGIQGHIDTLTGLRNQYGFFEDLNNSMKKRSELCVSMVGISGFSEINEVYGYEFGNRILQTFGRYLFEHIGNSGHVYRLDSTKFAIMSKTASSEEMRERYEELRQYFRRGSMVDGRFVILDLNAGLLNVDSFDIDYQTVYACLNFSYGESKMRRQGDMVEFYNDLNDENKQRIEKLYDIRASVMQDYKGFFLLYQPVVDASTEALIGAEALLRWQSDKYGTVPPDHFVPLLEKDPMFCNLGQWILRTAIKDAKRIMKKKPDFIINVNISYTQLEKPDFVDMIINTLKEEDYPASHLCLEITERCRLLDMYLLKNIIINLRGRGVKIALDDFGTGFASVGLIKSLPFDTIKIDKCFVEKIEEDEKDRALICSFAGMASTFGAKVCVEGIETRGMRDILQQYHIQSFQGYYYGKPLELIDFISWEPNKKEQ